MTISVNNIGSYFTQYVRIQTVRNKTYAYHIHVSGRDVYNGHDRRRPDFNGIAIVVIYFAPVKNTGSFAERRLHQANLFRI